MKGKVLTLEDELKVCDDGQDRCARILEYTIKRLQKEYPDAELEFQLKEKDRLLVPKVLDQLRLYRSFLDYEKGLLEFSGYQKVVSESERVVNKDKIYNDHARRYNDIGKRSISELSRLKLINNNERRREAQ